ncbi:MAG: dienelactone hydrolase family protein [Ginsengibacter sp.]
MKNKILLIAACFLLPALVSAQHHGAFQKYQYIQGSDTLPYRLLLPASYNHFDTTTKYPLIIFLHGSGERGNNNTSQLNHGGRLFTNDSIMLNYPAVVIFPQCAARSRWSNFRMHKDTVTKIPSITFPLDLPPTKDMELLMQLIAEVDTTYYIDTQRIYVGGLSLGGMGTYDIVYRNPGKFAAAFPICGAEDPEVAKNMTGTAWWIFHGQKDSGVSVKYAQAMDSALKKEGVDVKLTIYPEAGHNSWDDAFKEPGLFDWMFEKKLKPFALK